jgi:hypothetical protein
MGVCLNFFASAYCRDLTGIPIVYRTFKKFRFSGKMVKSRIGRHSAGSVSNYTGPAGIRILPRSFYLIVTF